MTTRRHPSQRRTAAATLAALLLATLIAACGSGGGGGDGNSGAGAVSFSALSATRTEFVVAEGASVPDTTISAQVGGDLTVLDGRTLHVTVDDPVGLFAAAPAIRFDPGTRRASIDLVGRPQAAAGQRRGRLGVRVCLDAACASALTPAGYGIDMAITVRAGLRVSPAQVVLQVPFGTQPEPTLVRVQAPEGQDPTAFSAGIVAGPDNSQVFDITRQSAPGQEGVVVAPRLLPVGRHQRRLEVTAISASPGNGQVYLHEVPLVLEVLPSAVDHAVLPASLAFSIAYGTLALRPFTVGAVAQGGSFRLEPVIYDNSGEPPGTGYPRRNAWLSVDGDAWSVGVCDTQGCLPRGDYRATLRFVRLDAAGLPTGLVVDVPIALAVR